MTRQNFFPLAFMIGLSLIPILSIHAPRSLSFLPILFGVVMSIWWVFIKGEKLQRPKFYIVTILGVTLLSVLSLTWSFSPVEAYEKILKIAGILFLGIPLIALSSSVNRELLKPFLWLFPSGVTIAALLCSFDLATNLKLYFLTHTIEPGKDVGTAVMNRGVVCTILSYFPALFFTHKSDLTNKAKYFLITIMTLSTLLMLSLTQSQSGQMAFALGVLMMFVFPHRYKHAYSILSILIICAMLLTPWIVDMLYPLLIDDAQTIPWLKDGYASNRIEIWNFVMKYAQNSPLYGYGIEATRNIIFTHDQLHHNSPTVLHPHNFSIQLWMEFGIVGITLGAILFTFLIDKISQLDIQSRKIIIAVFVATLSVASIGYGLWQSWWLGEFLFLISLCLIVSKPQQP